MCVALWWPVIGPPGAVWSGSPRRGEQKGSRDAIVREVLVARRWIPNEFGRDTKAPRRTGRQACWGVVGGGTVDF